MKIMIKDIKQVVPLMRWGRKMFWETVELSLLGNISHLCVFVHNGLHFLHVERFLKV